MTGNRASLGRVRGTLTSVGAALGFVMLGLASLGTTVVALWLILSLARSTATGDSEVSPGWAWALGVLVTMVAPFVLAAWKHTGDARSIRTTMSWLPLTWNAAGLIVASQLIPDLVGTALRRNGAWVAAENFGDTHSSTRVLSALGHHTADTVDPDGADLYRTLPPLLDSGDVEPDRIITVPFEESGAAIVMTATLEGPHGTLELPYLFDTGASYTTISLETAKTLGINVPQDAPTLKFNTAGGPRESRMVHLPALHVDDVRIPGLLVSVCDACATERSHGLLGLNVMREFFVQMDYKERRMTLLPRKQLERPNRAYDVDPVVDLAVYGSPEVWLGRVHWIIQITNRSTVPVENATPLVKFVDGPRLVGQTVKRVEPGETVRSLVEGRAAAGEREFTLELFEAYW